MSERSRDAVLAAIAELGYVPNPAARSLVTRRTDTGALVISERGRSAIATISGPQDMVAGLDRRAGYETALLSVVREVSDDLVELGDFSEQGGASAMRQLLERRPDIDAVFAANDLMAVGAMGYLRDAADTRRADHPAGSGAGAVGLPARLVVRGSS